MHFNDVTICMWPTADSIDAGMSLWALGGGADFAAVQGKCKQCSLP
jgi:hypothetical protein